MMKRFPKLGFRKHRFNKDIELTQLNLGKLAYHIEKGHIDTEKQRPQVTETQTKTY